MSVRVNEIVYVGGWMEADTHGRERDRKRERKRERKEKREIEKERGRERYSTEDPLLTRYTFITGESVCLVCVCVLTWLERGSERAPERECVLRLLLLRLGANLPRHTHTILLHALKAYLQRHISTLCPQADQGVAEPIRAHTHAQPHAAQAPRGA